MPHASASVLSADEMVVLVRHFAGAEWKVLGDEKGCVPVVKILPLVTIADKYKKLGNILLLTK
jgi:hypothetical protein